MANRNKTVASCASPRRCDGLGVVTVGFFKSGCGVVSLFALHGNGYIWTGTMFCLMVFAVGFVIPLVVVGDVCFHVDQY